MSKDMGPEGRNGLPCPFCACPLFSTFELFSNYFVKTHLSNYNFTGSHSEWGFSEATCVIGLVNLINDHCPEQKRTTNISIAELVRCDPSLIVKFRKIKTYLLCQDSLNNGDLLTSGYFGSLAPSNSAGDENFDGSITAGMQDLRAEISGISALLKDQGDSPAPSNIDSPRFTPVQDLYACLFCDRSFPSCPILEGTWSTQETGSS